MLYFLEDPEDVDPNFKAVDGQLSFRVIGETSKTINPEKANILANKIAAEFGANNGYIWKKCKTRCRYLDTENGYDLRVNSRNVNEPKALIVKALSIQGLTPKR